jgi:uroporphyrinogen-III synthase
VVDTPLAGVRVLVTRPAHQAQTLAALIEHAGGTAIRFPTLAIVPARDPGNLRALFSRLAEFDLAIFISPNAVEQAMALLQHERLPWPNSLRLAGIGAGTAQALARFHLAPALVPERYDSEALLAHPELAQVAGRRVLILRGEGGRERLASALTERGAAVHYAECYRRVRPAVDTAPLRALVARGDVDIISVTSIDGLHNLCEMAGDERGRLLRTPIVVLSESQAAAGRALGFETEPVIAAAASDAAILNAIKTWRATRFSL